MKSLLIFCLLIGISLGAPVEGPGKINDLPTLNLYQPEKPPVVPIKLGHRSKFDYKPFLGEVLNRRSLAGWIKTDPTKMEFFNFLWLIWDH